MFLRFCILAFLLMAHSLLFAETEPEIYAPIHSDVSPVIRTIPPAPLRSGIKRLDPVEHATKEWSDAPANTSPDPAAQLSLGVAAAPATSANFDGLRAQGEIPPDTNGEAGINHYVQMVNRQFAVYSKSGALVYGPVNINTLWSGFGGVCQTNNQGDPIVVYDQLANRWLLSQFAYVDPSTFVECVAVSATSDPTGNYYRYSYSFPYFNDYPKFAVWPDGYYSTYILRNFDWSVVGSRICAFERSRMLTGDTARVLCFAVNQFALLPADLDGINLPPAASPHFSMNLSGNKLNLWKTQVDWITPGNSKVTGPTSLTVNSYTPACIPSRVCVPQPGTSQKLDAFSDRLMFRLSYRNTGSYETLVTNHTVDAGGGISGIRWYEVRNPGGSPVLFQQGTYSPDSKHRWMGSIATDRNGNMGLGYNVSSGGVYPGIRYTGRLSTDSKGAMTQGEGVLINGAGSQTGTPRWGDYSDMTIDPVDDCTFWYTTEYIPAGGGSLNWRTRIGSFRLDGCGCADPVGVPKPSAADLAPGADTGVLITWLPDPESWGDNGEGTRSYEVVRNKNVIATLPYGTTSYVDNAGVNGQEYKYKVRYRNGCGEVANRRRALAADL